VPQGESLDRDDFLLFSESNSRFLVEVALENRNEFEAIMNDTSCAAVGRVTDTATLEIYGLNGKKVVNTAIADLKEAWQRPLRW
jgi:phosphoribosylformylglycinamidine synthase